VIAGSIYSTYNKIYIGAELTTGNAEGFDNRLALCLPPKLFWSSIIICAHSLYWMIKRESRKRERVGIQVGVA
jgi:hypothetical protein